MLIEEPETTPERRSLYDGDVAEVGYVMNLTRLWAWHPDLISGLFELLGVAADRAGLTYRDKGVLVTAAASTLGDAYCALAWGTRLAQAADPATAADVIQSPAGQAGDPRDAALAAWASQLASDPNATTEADVARLRSVGFDDAQIAAIAVYVALRLAFSTVNDGLGAAPDAQLVDSAPPLLRQAVAFGRPPAQEASPAE